MTGLVRLKSGRLAVSGIKRNSGVATAFVLIIDSSGKTVQSQWRSWKPSLSPPPAASPLQTGAHGLWLASDGSLVLAAEAALVQPLGGVASDSWLVGLSEDGEPLWQRALGLGSATDSLSDVAGLPGDKLAVAGLNAGKLRLLRTGPWGHASCGSAGLCAQQTRSTCADSNPCTATVCVPQTGCATPKLSDGSACPGGTCSAGVCPP